MKSFTYWDGERKENCQGGREEEQQRGHPTPLPHRDDGGVEPVDLQGGVRGGGYCWVGCPGYVMYTVDEGQAPAEHVEGEAGQVKHEAGHEHRVGGGQHTAHQVQGGGL